MSRLSKQVREYVKCPQLDGGTHYGEWGALRLDQRKQIAKLCEEVDVFEDAADKFGKENYILKQILTEKEREIERLNSQNHFFMEETQRLNQIVNFQHKEIEGWECSKRVKDAYLQERHQICEKIRYCLLNHIWCDKDCRYVADIDKELDQIEKGE